MRQRTGEDRADPLSRFDEGPLAVVTDKRTSSVGEMLLIALLGQARPGQSVDLRQHLVRDDDCQRDLSFAGWLDPGVDAIPVCDWKRAGDSWRGRTDAPDSPGREFS